MVRFRLNISFGSLMTLLFIGLLCQAALIGTTHANDITAVVEEYSGGNEEISLLDMLEEGRVIDLSDGKQVVLGYFLSCIRETITGGKVTIGIEESQIEGSERTVEEVDCDGGEVVADDNNTDEIAGVVFRNREAGSSLPKPDWTLFGMKPLIMVDGETKSITIKRIDKEQKAVSINVTGSSVDGVRDNIILEPSGLYIISAGSKSRIIKVSPLAEMDAPILSRLVPM